MKIMLLMANYAKHYASTIYQSLRTFCLSFLESILCDFEESLGFLHLGLGRGGGGGGGGVENENPSQIHW